MVGLEPIKYRRLGNQIIIKKSAILVIDIEKDVMFVLHRFTQYHENLLHVFARGVTFYYK